MRRIRCAKIFNGPYSKDCKGWPSINPESNYDKWMDQKGKKYIIPSSLKQCTKCGGLAFIKHDRKLCDFCKR